MEHRSRHKANKHLECQDKPLFMSAPVSSHFRELHKCCIIKGAILKHIVGMGLISKSIDGYNTMSVSNC